MVKKWLTWLNMSIAGIAGALLLFACIFAFIRPSEIALSDAILSKRPLPSGSFTMPKEAYNAIGKAGCELKFSPMTLQLPDLRTQLTYYGKNGRPDAQAERPVLHFVFSNSSTPISVTSGERLYLQYDKSRSPNQYVCSPENADTPLWIEATAQGSEAVVKVGMRNENGDVIRDPSAHAQFSLQEKEALRSGGKTWEIGKYRVDGSLLARQKARWMGPDKFLERHGGDEFRDLQSKHRIDFTEEEDTYSVYVGLNESLIWDNGKWKAVQPGKDSLGHPLMVVKKIDERLMNFELWDVGGKGKVPLTLVKINEMWMPQNVQDKFKFLGARTRSQYIFEIDAQRMLLSPKDWLLQTDDGWIKLTTPQQIDDYVDRKLIGVLFVVDGAIRKGGRQALVGVMFNPARTEMQEVEIAVQQGNGGSVANVSADDEDDDDDDDDDDIPPRSYHSQMQG